MSMPNRCASFRYTEHPAGSLEVIQGESIWIFSIPLDVQESILIPLPLPNIDSTFKLHKLMSEYAQVQVLIKN